jgi:hypothetical protein
LHFQGQHPGKNHYDNDKQKRYLKFDIAGKYPGKKRSFDDGYFSFFHCKAPLPRINGWNKRVYSGFPNDKFASITIKTALLTSRNSQDQQFSKFDGRRAMPICFDKIDTKRL